MLYSSEPNFTSTWKSGWLVMTRVEGFGSHGSITDSQRHKLTATDRSCLHHVCPLEPRAAPQSQHWQSSALGSATSLSLSEPTPADSDKRSSLKEKVLSVITQNLNMTFSSFSLKKLVLQFNPNTANTPWFFKRNWTGC